MISAERNSKFDLIKQGSTQRQPVAVFGTDEQGWICCR